jgi:Major coat protein-like
MAKHEMVSMKRPKKKSKAEEVTPTSDYEEPQYGYGLMLRLENFELDKLSMELPKIGKKVTVQAEGFVESVHESESMHNKGDRSVGIQITELGVYDT